jgi:hypothetical protein
MKRNTPAHPKMGLLARELHVMRPTAGGLLEFLWHFAATYAHDGELTGFTAAQIAEAVYWPTKKAQTLIDALARTRWLDVVGERIIIHDWPENCEDSVHKYLAMHKMWFADGTVPKLRMIPKSEKHELVRFYEANQYHTSSVPVRLAVVVAVAVAVALPSPTSPGDTTAGEPVPKEPTPTTKPKPEKKPHPPNPYADAFKVAFDANFPETYAWQEGDFAQLTKWRRTYPAVTVERFIEVAQECWTRGNFTPGGTLTIRGLCSGWAQYAASGKLKSEGSGTPVFKEDPMAIYFGQKQAERSAAAKAAQETPL